MTAGVIRFGVAKRDPYAWYVPPWVAFSLPLRTTCVLVSILLPVLAWLQAADISKIYLTAVGLGAVGAVLLYIARLPLYRSRKFWTVGPKQLNQAHRKIYWLAYGFVVLSLMTFAALNNRV